MIWDKKYADTTFYGGPFTIDELDNGDIITSGNGAFDDGPGIDGLIVKTDSEGDSLWMRRYRYFPTDDNEQNDLAFTSDNGFIITGMAMGEPEWIQSVWIQKLDSIGCDSAGCDPTVGIYEGQGGMGAWRHGGMEAWRHGGMEIWPNPATDLIHITFRSNNLSPYSSGNRELEIFNVFGEKVAEIKMSVFQESYSQDIFSLAQGLYLVVVRERQKVICTGKFLISR
jgi:hypothetical protein